jgi:hypothetical protein
MNADIRRLETFSQASPQHLKATEARTPTIDQNQFTLMTPIYKTLGSGFIRVHLRPSL